MYSLVLAAMLTTGEVTPDFGRGCWGCYGCCGGCYGCRGCYGGCHGCYGSCYGCWGCYGSCYGCWGCCGGCYGSCHGCYGSCYGCWGCYGSCYGWGGCHGCYGGCHGSIVIIQQAPAAPKMDKDKKDKKTSVDQNRATVVVEVPAEAGLFVDGQSVPMTSRTQTFDTPALVPGQTYYYTMRAVGDRDGQLLSQTKRVELRAGETVRVVFADLKPETGAAVARVSVRLPAQARLFVDGVVCPLTSSKREFDTPKLEPGRKYAYTLKAELVRDGQTLTEEKQVILQAGRKVNVDFNKLRAEAAASR